MIDRIIENVYISGAGDVLAGDGLLKYGITHVLTVSAIAVPINRRVPSIKYHFIFIMDLPNQDILGGGQLAESVAYISDTLSSGGSVLVHW
uniref:Tyrosine-protein phosphatase domain-containing protein n=1 Tax=Angiostrongylus cantonensis TaxID=6313 RepID=A0A0K0DPT4_ANGCA